MSNDEYYEGLKALARYKRSQFNINSKQFGFREIRAIYKHEKIRIDPWPNLSRRMKAMYMCDDDEASVAIKPDLPDEPRLFALVHELKHHYVDQELLRSSGFISCGDYNQNALVEKGAEVFAAEFIYPEAEFLEDVQSAGIVDWTPEVLVGFKRTCGVRVSYHFFRKRLARCGLIQKGAWDSIRFRNLEEELHGAPFYRRRIYARR